MTRPEAGRAAAAARLRILIVGVGGQGVLTAARHLGEACLRTGHEAVLGQLHGMSQRGGSVESTVVVGGAESSFIEEGEADVVLGLEPLETLRARPRMHAQTRVVTSTTPVVPHLLSQMGKPYPPLPEILSAIRAAAPDLTTLDSAAIVRQAGARRALNVAMLGALAALEVLPFPAAALWSAVAARTPERFVAGNRRAFELGGAAAKARTSPAPGRPAC
ncbi:MAG: indolepyruvate oxidoreductase subunit beta [Planctomycetes bacterium]|nr:indolepyruvate oxidoreductase subunit beta [Planctomycetota bacterium]